MSKRKSGDGWDSGLEKKVAQAFLDSCGLEAQHCEDKIPYKVVIHAEYNPDMVFAGKDFTPKAKYDKVYFEVKGRHRTDFDMLKAEHKARQVLDNGDLIVFIFDNPYTKLPRRTTLTHAKWADNNGFPWITVKTAHTWPKQLAEIVSKEWR